MKPPKRTPNAEQEIEQKRRKIDQIDKIIIRGIVKRTRIARAIGFVKQQDNAIIYRPDREKKVFHKIEKNLESIQKKDSNKNYMSLQASDLFSIYREIISLAKAYEGGLLVHYLGPKASFSHLAVLQSFGHSVRMKPELSIPAVFQSVAQAKNSSTYGIVPIDNTLEGSIGLTLDELYETDLKIFAEKYIFIEQCLIAKKVIDFHKIEKIYSVKVAFDQCRQWLLNNFSLRDIELVEVVSTSRAAQIVAESRSSRVAAIGSLFAKDTYGLQILAQNIQDVEHNITRFIEISKNQCPRSGEDKTSIAFSLPDKPGQLAKILDLFAKKGVNLTKVESRINKRLLGSYVFFLDFLGHVEDEHIMYILNKMHSLVHFFKILGSYPSMTNLMHKKKST